MTLRNNTRVLDETRPGFMERTELAFVQFCIRSLNSILKLLERVSFRKLGKPPGRILVFKLGNIGDVVCAVPSLIAVRRAFPSAQITLLTSPGVRGSFGAKGFLSGAWYLDEIISYYTDDLDSWHKKSEFIKRLRSGNYDLFIQLPDDLADFSTLVRNMFFAKFVGARSAFGFKMRAIRLFKNTQTDYSPLSQNEVENLLDILRANGIAVDKIEFDFPVTEAQKEKVNSIISNKWPSFNKGDSLLVALGPGAKEETREWPAERFAEVAKYLHAKRGAKFVIVGANEDVPKAELIASFLPQKDVLITAGSFDVLETIELFKRASFLIANDTGSVHMAAAVGLPVVGLYSVHNPFGKWFPYGEKHKILYHRFINCDYKKDACLAESLRAIAVEEVEQACDELIANLL